MDEPAIHITWAVFSVIALIFIIIAWTVVAKAPSRQNGIHAFVASLLTSRAIFCLSVTLLFVAFAFAEDDWNILACHALYWLWTVTWSSDLLAAVAALGWGLRKLRCPTSAFRLGSTVAIAGMWLIATTLAGILTYFNNSIKSTDYLINIGCSVVPNPEERSITIALFVFQCSGVLLSLSMFFSFVIKFQIALKYQEKEFKQTKSFPHMANGVVPEGVECINGVAIAKEPGRLEAIEDRRKRRQLTGSNGAHFSELDLEQLSSWRRVYCIIEGLLLLLNITPQLVFTGMNIFNDARGENFTLGLMVIVSCHLIYGLLLPFLLILVSPEYRATLIGLSHCKHDRERAPEPPLPSIDCGTRSQAPSVQITTTQPMAANIQVPEPSPKVRPESAALRVTPRRYSLASRRLSAPGVGRSESGLSRLEWKEQMMEKFKIPVDVLTIEQGGTDEGTDTAPSRQASVRESDETDSDTGFRYNDSDIESVLKRQTSGVDNEGFQEEEGELERQKTQSTAVKEEESVTGSHEQPVFTCEPMVNVHEPFVRNEIVYSPTNPFLQGPPMQNDENESVSDKSVEAEIVAITIKGKGSLKRRLRDHGLWPGRTYITKGDNAFVKSPNVKQKSNPPDRYGAHGPQTSLPSTACNQYNPLNIANTNPFINDIECGYQNRTDDANFAEIQGWLESMDDHITCSNYDSDVDDTYNINRRKASSNPFLQDIPEYDSSTPDFFNQSPSIYREVFMTRSAPSSPRLNRRLLSGRSAGIAVSIADLLKSKSDRLAFYDAGDIGVCRGLASEGRRNDSSFDPELDRPHSSCSYLSRKMINPGWRTGESSQRNSKYITEYV